MGIVGTVDSNYKAGACGPRAAEQGSALWVVALQWMWRRIRDVQALARAGARERDPAPGAPLDERGG